MSLDFLPKPSVTTEENEWLAEPYHAPCDDEVIFDEEKYEALALLEKSAGELSANETARRAEIVQNCGTCAYKCTVRTAVRSQEENANVA